jgi:phosphoglycerate dehydrogenase-like enzyme
MKHILVTAPLGPEGRAYLEGAVRGRAQVQYREELQGSALEAAARGAHILLVWGRQIDFEGLLPEAMQNLEMVQTLLAGVETLPFNCLPPRAVVCSGTGALTHPVAEHALALLLVAAKRVVWGHSRMVAGEFPQGKRPSRLLAGATLGVVGTGDIGGEVLRLGRALGMRTIGVNRSGRPHAWADEAVAVPDLHRALAPADAVVLAVPLTKETRGLIGKAELAAMKPDAILVNVARGKVIDEEALYQHLRSQPLFTAALDVWWNYPKGGKGHASRFPFHELDNVVMTPHGAGIVEGFQEIMVRHAADNIGRFLDGQEPGNRIERKDYL